MSTTAASFPSTAMITLNIIPDTDTIHTFRNDDSILPNESYTLSGRVEVTLARPIQIRQLSVQFKGTIDSIVSAIDFFQDTGRNSNRSQNDEIPIAKWDTIDANNTFVNKFARRALGHGNATSTIIRETIDLFELPKVLEVGTTVYPFSMTINNVHLLPPSFLSPHHVIQYALSARIKLNSIGERVKISYWNARSSFTSNNNTNASFVSSCPSTNPVVSQPPSATNYNITAAAATTAIIAAHDPTPASLSESITRSRSFSSNEEDTTSNQNRYSTASSVHNDVNTTPSSTNTLSLWQQLRETNKSKRKRQLLGVSKDIQLRRHSYPNIYSLSTSVARIRYRGARQDRITYEICMSKFTCLQKKTFPFICKFNSLYEEARVEYMEYYLEQTEAYPIRTGDFDLIKESLPLAIVPRRRKLCRTKHNMSNYQNGEELKLHLNLNLPHITPQIDTRILQITHKLRLILKFKDSKKERNMSLSFPLNVGTVPISTSMNSDELMSVEALAETAATTTTADHRLQVPTVWSSTMYSCSDYVSNRRIHVRHELDEWLLAPAEQDYGYHVDDEDDVWNKLPSYRDVLKEGNPPSPFIEDIN